MTDTPHTPAAPNAGIARRGILFVISSPSGAGKTTLTRRLLKADDEVEVSVSYTTRPPRPGETDGKDYSFVGISTFERMRDEGAFLESAKVFGHYYGTPRAPVIDAIEAGRDVIFDIDWQGAQQLAERARGDLVTVFILPPSRAALEDRLRRRAQDSEEVVRKRMAQADAEMSHYAEYGYVIVNDDLSRAERQLHHILGAERLKRTRQTGLRAFVQKVIGEQDG
ncbi:guanylate kinase [Parvularcula dongshanensis]|uniref:Guanylate kinase n=1 Tax=Parvularcula dongshanensis TaxID=1173995 RepID=A0A840I5J8_9PROT|nr:guanylate kinase [Parvularcula dongshanensis]MBB4660129.1 guanylate kinase [Parvularcula dongshanensis]